jgi:predicted nucleic acid-binding protein
MGLLRLLTNESVMGSDVLSSRDAWRAYRTILADERIQFAPEPFALEPEWRRLTAQDRPTPKLWTDAYLAAFARAGGMRLVTLDQAAVKMAPEALLLK